MKGGTCEACGRHARPDNISDEGFHTATAGQQYGSPRECGGRILDAEGRPIPPPKDYCMDCPACTKGAPRAKSPQGADPKCGHHSCPHAGVDSARATTEPATT